MLHLTYVFGVRQVFTFMHMGGAQEKLELKMIGHIDDRAFTTFDADKAKCYDPGDRQKLLAVIEAAFGDIERFNQAVRKLLINAVHAKLEREVSTFEKEVSKLGVDVKSAHSMIAWMRLSRAGGSRMPPTGIARTVEGRDGVANAKDSRTGSNLVTHIGPPNDGMFIEDP